MQTRREHAPARVGVLSPRLRTIAAAGKGTQPGRHTSWRHERYDRPGCIPCYDTCQVGPVELTSFFLSVARSSRLPRPDLLLSWPMFLKRLVSPWPLRLLSVHEPWFGTLWFIQFRRRPARRLTQSTKADTRASKGMRGRRLPGGRASRSNSAGPVCLTISSHCSRSIVHH